MNVKTMTRESEGYSKVRDKYHEYLKAVKERHSAEYVALKNAYRELCRGKQVIDLVEAIRGGGFDQLGRPRLACIQANAKLCWFRAERGRLIFNQENWLWRVYKAKSVTIPRVGFGDVRMTDQTLRAVVPSVPPSLLPAGDLSKYHILWEAEWETMPVDPILLKHLGGFLYVVLAQWDLTPVERAALYGKLPS